MVGGPNFGDGFPKILSSKKESCVADILSSLSRLSRNLSFSSALLDREGPMAANLMELVKDVFVSSNDPHVRIWSPMSTGNFSLSLSFPFLYLVPSPEICSQLEKFGILRLLLRCRLSHG